MKNKKPIVVRMNGKESKLNRKGAFAKKTEHPPVNEEQAATIEDADEPIPTFARKTENKDPLNKKKTWGAFKPIAISIVAAVITGSILGFIMLNMFGGAENTVSNDGNNNSAMNTASNDDNDDNANASASESQTSLDAFVLQGGVFSEKENADKWAKTFTELGFPAVIWEKESQYYLLTGIASTEKQAKQLATSMKENELDVFSKEWSTGEGEATFSKEEATWLDAFNKQWQNTLQSVSKQKGMSVADWEKLVDTQPEDSEGIANLVEKIEGLLENMEQADEKEAQTMLLSIWQQYDELLT